MHVCVKVKMDAWSEINCLLVYQYLKCRYLRHKNKKLQLQFHLDLKFKLLKVYRRFLALWSHLIFYRDWNKFREKITSGYFIFNNSTLNTNRTIIIRTINIPHLRWLFRLNAVKIGRIQLWKKLIKVVFVWCFKNCLKRTIKKIQR
jgi:hypothetical protein